MMQALKMLSWLKAAASSEGVLRWELGSDARAEQDIREWCGYRAYAIVKYSRSHLCRRDFVLVTFNNGQGERQPIYTISGKGHKLVRYYVPLKQLVLSQVKPTLTPACPGWEREALRVAADLNRILARAE